MNRRTISCLALASVLTLAACGEDNAVGDDSTFDFDQETAEQLGGSTTTTTVAGQEIPDQTTTTAAQQAAGATTTTVAQTTTTVAPEKQEVSVEITIRDDGQGQPFDPRIVAVPVGGKVRFVNRGTKPYTVRADNGAFDSGPIAPGAVWIWDANAAGQFNYTDAGRPYAVGTIDVVQ